MAKPRVVLETVVEEIDEKRITIAVTYSTDSVLNGIWADITQLLFFSVVVLLVGIFVRDMRITALVAAIVGQVAFYFMYSASLVRQEKARKLLRETLEVEVRKFRDSLPPGSGFGCLFNGPPVPQIWGLTMDKKKQA